MYGVLGACLKSASTCFLVFLILSVWYQWQWGVALPLAADRVALLAIKASVKADPQALFSDWNEDVDHCRWRGVGCDVSGRVFSLNLTGRDPNLRDCPTSNCSSYCLIHKALGGCKLPCVAYAKTIYLSTCPNRSSNNTSFAACESRGTLSPAVGHLEKLRLLSLPFNGFFGKIPKKLCSLKFLEHVDLQGNEFSGTLPSKLGHLTKLKTLNVAHNGLQGMIPREISSCKKLEVLNMAGNRLSGRVPPFFQHMPNLRVVALSSNWLSGTIPKELTSNCGSLTHLHLEENYLVGKIPQGFGNCSHLQSLLLSSNALSGTIPADIGQLQELQVLDVSCNSLGSNIPNELANCSQLSTLVLTNNLAFCQKLPSVAEGASSYQKGENNNFSSIPTTLMALPNLRLLWAPITTALGGALSARWGSRLEILNHASNSLPGSICKELAHCKWLIYLDLSNNKLEGNLPSMSVQCMAVFNVSGNVPTGELPEQFSIECLRRILLEPSLTYVPKSLCAIMSAEGNELLKPRALLTPAPSNQVDEEPYAGNVVPPKKNNHPNAIMIAAITSGCAIAVVLIILVLLFHFLKQDLPVKVFHRQERKQLTMFHSFEFEVTYEAVVSATGNFSVNNLIGTGGFGATYKAELSPGFLVAVKRLSWDKFQGTQEFEAEIRTLESVHHPNLVTLIGYHASDNEKFLIYNFFPGGNLMSLIHDQRRGSISWRVRLRIALNIAEGLAYLHDECKPRVVHRDIKPSNVLLDDNLNAFLSDFGLARLLTSSQTHATTDVLGTYGYVAPEYVMMCCLSEKADVYSYGVLLLELLSGKKALDPYFSSFGNGFNIVQWALHFHKKGKSLEILAPGLWEQGLQSELKDAIKLAVRCTMTSLSVRPKMKQVVDILRAMGGCHLY